MSGNRGPRESSFGPTSGFDPCRLMWSEISTRPPRSSVRLMPPAALVNTMDSHAQLPQHADAERRLAPACSLRRDARARPSRPRRDRRVCPGRACRRVRRRWTPASREFRRTGDPRARSARRRMRPGRCRAPRRWTAAAPCGSRCTPWLLASQQHSGDAGRHEIGHRSRRHRPQSQPRQVRFAVGRQRADAADLNGDGAEVGEPAQRVGRDGERARIELSPSSGPSCRNATNSLSTSRVPSRLPMVEASFHGTPSSQAMGAKTIPKIFSQGYGQPAHVGQPVQPAQNSVDHGDQRQERDQHCRRC